MTASSSDAWPVPERMRNDAAQGDGPLPRTPVFLVGFPRSGTTLIDRFMGRHPRLECIEEKGLLDTLVERNLSPAEMRRTYWELAGPHWSGAPDRCLVDRMPMAFLHAPLIQDLWPGAPIVFALRHPADVVLSCFMQDFRPNALTVHFETIASTVDFYCRSMQVWLRDRQHFRHYIHEMRYEELVKDPAGEMRKLIDWLGLEWDECMMHETGQEPVPGTASYHQVSEPVYRHAVERWRNYREQLSPWLMRLDPLARELGYRLDVGAEA